MQKVKIGKRYIGASCRCFIIAEIGSNHNQDLKTACRLVDSAKSAGADAVKFQSFIVENWISREMTTFPTVAAKGDLRRFLKGCELPYSMYMKIKEYCKRRKIICFSTPSHISDVKKLFSIGTPAFKFGSVQITDIPTIKYAARTGKPIILSTGASGMSDIKETVKAIKESGNRKIVLLHCTSLYPTPFDKLNLNVIPALRKRFNLPVGFSDHTLDPVVAPVAAVVLGACVIEKHLTLNRKMKGPDHRFALEPEEFSQMVQAIRAVEASLGSYSKKMLPEEEKIALWGRRSIVAQTCIPKGIRITPRMLTLKRPGTGIRPKYIGKILGKIAKEDIERDTVIRWEKVRCQ